MKNLKYLILVLGLLLISCNNHENKKWRKVVFETTKDGVKDTISINVNCFKQDLIVVQEDDVWFVKQYSLPESIGNHILVFNEPTRILSVSD